MWCNRWNERWNPPVKLHDDEQAFGRGNALAMIVFSNPTWFEVFELRA